MFETLESRALLVSDFGDAPDTGAGTGIGNYQTLLANGGPSHVIDASRPTLFLGARVDSESDATPNTKANGDDINSPTSLDDEDGLVEPVQDLVLTVGTAPTVRVRATNPSGSLATLYGWIDYNRDGVFDNATERASVAVPTGTNNGTFTLAFPTIPVSTAAGTTYARFRLSTDAAAANSTGPANGGEVEDYTASITRRSDGTSDSTKTKKIASGINGGPTLVDGYRFGRGVTSIGDLDGDGVSDLAVGAFYDATGGLNRGAIYVQFMNANGTVKNSVKIASNTNGGPALADSDIFGVSVASLGDLDGDGITDLAVGAIGDDTGGSYRGAVYVLLMNANGTAKSSVKIASGLNGGPTLENGGQFGHGITSLGDLDGDAVTEIVVGALYDNAGGIDRGAVYVLFLNANGTVKSSVKIASGINGGPTLANGDLFGISVASLRDLDGDGVTDLAVGAINDDTGGLNRGAVHVLLLNANGTVKSSLKIASGLNGGPSLPSDVLFGFSLASLGDLDGNGVTDLAVGAVQDDTGGQDCGAIYVLMLNASGTVKSSLKIASGLNGGPTLSGGDVFGDAVASLGDLDGNGVTELAVGATLDDTGGQNRGAMYVLFLKALTVTDFGDAPDTSAGTGTGNYQTLLADNGPRHDFATTQTTLFLGARVDVEVDATQNARANGDDITTLPDDEHGLVEPAQDLQLTIGSTPAVRVRATNITGSAAMLYGWIDYNRDGVFDNSTERASVAVPTGTNKGIFTLSFPAVPVGAGVGTTYARFRVSSDAAAANSTGAANGGEVEDHTASIVRRSDGAADGAKTKKIANGTSGGPTIMDGFQFGRSVTSIGDLDGDGVPDNATGSIYDGTGGLNRGAVYVQFMNSNGTVRNSVKVASNTNGGPTLADRDRFGHTVASLGDLDGDGVADLAVGATGDDTGGSYRGAVYVLLMNANGTAKSSVKIASGLNGGPTLENGGEFGHGITSLGDLDGDGMPEVAVGALREDAGGFDRGAVYVLFLNANGSAKSSVKIASGTNGGPALSNSDLFGISVASLRDLDGDGVTDLAVGAINDDTGGLNRGAVHVLFLNSNGTVKSSLKIASGLNGGPLLPSDVLFGFSLASLGDLDGNGVTDLAVGAPQDDTGGVDCGAVYVMLLNPSGTVKGSVKIASGLNGGPTLSDGDVFSDAVASLGDLDGDGVTEIAVGAPLDDTGGANRGALYVMYLKALTTGVTTSFSAGMLTVTGTGTADDILIDQVGGAGGSVRVFDNGAQIGSFAAAAVNFIVVNSGGGDDSIRIDGTTNPVEARIGTQLTGDAGDDTINGGLGADFINGKDGNDILNGNAGNDTLIGWNFDSGNSGRDVMRGGEGIDSIQADFLDIDTAPGTPTVLGGDGPNNASAAFISGDELKLDSPGFVVTQNLNLVNDMTAGLAAGIGGFEIIKAGSGNDTLTVINATANDGVLLIGGDGNDLLIGSLGQDQLQGDTGNDTLIGRENADVLIGGSGDDTLDYSGSPVGTVVPGFTAGFGNFPVTGVVVDLRATGPGIVGSQGGHAQGDTYRLDDVENVIGTSGNDYIIGNNLNNVLLDGGDGNDTIIGRGGNDNLIGGNGNDVLIGSEGSIATAGDTDTFDGGSGDDQIFADLADLLVGPGVGGVATPRILGGAGGTDILDFQFSNGITLFINDFGGSAVTGGFEQVLGSAGNDRIETAGPAPNLYYLGRGGNDILRGGGGNDTLDGEDGIDTLRGGAGGDTFIRGEMIEDFNVGEGDQSFP